MQALLSDPAVWIGFLTLTVLEIVLGIDNIVFIAILAGKLPAKDQPRARKIGLAISMVTRVVMLLCIGIILRLTAPLFMVPFLATPEAREISAKDLVLIIGGLFLMGKATHEIHHKLEGQDDEVSVKGPPAMGAILVQMFILNVVFSIDSVVTAIGMSDKVAVMVAAVVASSLFMVWFANPVANFVEKHPTIKMLALAFLVLIGVNLLADGFGQHIPKGYTYFAMAFSVLVEMLNLKMRHQKGKPVHLHGPTVP